MGISAGIAAIGEAIASISLSGVAIGAGIGAVGGGLISAFSGKPILPGILEGGAAGGLTAGLGGIGGSLGAAAGIGSTAGSILGGAAGGALGSQITGGSPLLGAVEGGAGAGIASAIGGGSGADASAGADASTATAGTPIATDATAGAAPGAAPGASVGGPGASAASGAVPASVAADTGTLGQSLAGADPASSLVPENGQLPGVDATALQGQQALVSGGDSQGALSILGHQVPGTNATGSGLSTTANPELATSGAATEGTPAGGVSTEQVSPNVSEVTGLGAGTTQPASNTTNWGNFSNDPLGTVGSAIGNNSNWLVPAAGLGYSAIKAAGTTTPSTTANESALQGQANALSANSQQLQSYLQTGTLPSGVQNSITSATKAAKASIRSQYASHGMSGSSAEAQDLAAVDTDAASRGATIATQLLNTGVTEAQLADQIYSQLLSASVAQDNQLSQAVSGFASSLVPRTSTNITVTPSG